MTIARVFKVLCAAAARLHRGGVLRACRLARVALNTVVPHPQLTKDYFALLVAVLGTTISPYLFFWQSAHRVEELREEPEGGDRAVALDERPDAPHGLQGTNEPPRRRRSAWCFRISSCSRSSSPRPSRSRKNGHDDHRQRRPGRAGPPSRRRGSSTSALFAVGFIGAGLLAVPYSPGSAAAGISGTRRPALGLLAHAPPGPRLLRPGPRRDLGGAALSLFASTRSPARHRRGHQRTRGRARSSIVVMLIASQRRHHGRHRQRAPRHHHRLAHRRAADGRRRDPAITTS